MVEDGGGGGAWNRHHVYLPSFSQVSGERLSQFLRGSHVSHPAQLPSGCGHVQQPVFGGGNGGDGGGGGSAGGGGLGISHQL